MSFSLTKQARYRARLHAAGRCPHCGQPTDGYECAARRTYKRTRYAQRRLAPMIAVLRSELLQRDDFADGDLTDGVFLLCLAFGVRWRSVARALSIDESRALVMATRLRNLARRLTFTTAWDGPEGFMRFVLCLLVVQGVAVYHGDDRWSAVPSGPPRNGEPAMLRLEGVVS